MKKLAVLIAKEGTGSNLKAILHAIQEKKIQATVAVVISDAAKTKGLIFAKEFNIPIAICAKKEDLFPLLEKYAPDYICLAGWKKIIPDTVLLSFKNKILNLHPGLIPDTINGTVKNPDNTEALWNKGNYATIAIQNFLTRHVSYAGSSIHFLTDDFDFGPVLGRTFEKISPNDTVESLYERLKKKEHELYINVLHNLCQNSKIKSQKHK